jgi:hypothetical protein
MLATNHSSPHYYSCVLIDSREQNVLEKIIINKHYINKTSVKPTPKLFSNGYAYVGFKGIKAYFQLIESGNELPVELLQTLLKMAPTTEEELKLRLFSGDLSRLGPADRFLKVLVDFPFAFKRLESLLFMSSIQEEVFNVKESLSTLEVRQ